MRIPRPTPQEAVLPRDLLRNRTAAWGAFGAVHLWLAVLGVAIIPAQVFYDLQLYRYWMWLGVHEGQWPGIHTAWVYPAGAMVPMLVAAVGGLTYGSGYFIAWAVLITALDAGAFAVLIRTRRGLAAGWWWTAFLLLLGPVAMGRLDAVVTPLVILGLLWALDRPGVASFLLTVGAWVKVAPGALLAPLFLVTRRAWRTVLVPAAVTTAVVVGIVVGLGGGANVLSFLTEQDSRGLQIESIWSTPWLLVGLFSTSVTRFLDQTLNTWEITGPGTSVAANALGVLFDVAILAVVALVWWRRVRLGARLWEDATARHELLVRGALVMTLAMLACNKVLSPQYITWLAGPVAVAIAAGLPGWTRTRSGVLMVAGATQLVFPCFYNQITSGGAAVTLVLAARNAALVVLLVWSVAALLGRPPDEAHTDVARARASSAAHMAR